MAMCVICDVPFSTESGPLVTTVCGHIYHDDCIMTKIISGSLRRCGYCSRLLETGEPLQRAFLSFTDPEEIDYVEMRIKYEGEAARSVASMSELERNLGETKKECARTIKTAIEANAGVRAEISRLEAEQRRFQAKCERMKIGYEEALQEHLASHQVEKDEVESAVRQTMTDHRDLQNELAKNNEILEAKYDEIKRMRELLFFARNDFAHI